MVRFNFGASLSGLAVWFCAALVTASAAYAAKVHVENVGIDSGTCGPSASPCRSITQAIANATAGDTILVGPGLYSDDLDGDAAYNEPGEEASGGININKQLTVLSTHGAGATIYRYTQTGNAVALSANGIILGKKNKGFTVHVTQGANGINFNGTSGGTIAGNMVTIVPNGTAGSSGIAGGGGSGNTIRDNRVLGPYSPNPDCFLLFATTGTTLDRNTAVGCGVGFEMADFSLTATRNLAIDNIKKGFDTAGTVVKFTNNAAIANGTDGLTLGSTTNGLVQKNTFVGNRSNCGLNNTSGTAVNATKNYWGASTGPGADPADNVCNSGAGSSTTTAPFLTKPTTPSQAPQR